MMSLHKRFTALRATELGGLLHDSFHVGLWQGAVSIADLVQLALITHILGLNALGRFALVTSFVILVGQFFDVRVGTATTRFGAGRLAANDVRGLAGVFQFSYLIDVCAGLLSFAIISSLAPFVGPHLIGHDGALLLILYAATLLISTADESSVSVLRLLDRFRLLAIYSSGVEAVRIAFVVAALTISPSLISLLLALVAYDFVAAVCNFTAANIVFTRTFGRNLLLHSLAAFREKRGMSRMVVHTGLVSYARVAQVQLPTLLLGAISSTSQVAYYKVGSSAAAMVGRLADPGYAAVLPRMARLWSLGRKETVRHLVARSSLVAACVMTVALAVVIVARDPILRALGGGGGVHAGTVLVLLAAAQAVNGTLFWNTGLLYAAGRAGTVTLVALVGIGLQVALFVPLTIAFGADGAAVALLFTYCATNVVATAVAVRTIRDTEPTDVEVERATSTTAVS